MKRQLFWLICALLTLTAWGSDFAPAVPDLDLPSDTETVAAPAPAAPAVEVTTVKAAPTPRRSTQRRATANKAKRDVINVTNADINKDEIQVEKVTNIDPKLLIPIPQEPVIVDEPLQPQEGAAVGVGQGTFEPAREQGKDLPAEGAKKKVVFNPSKDRDPTLSPDDRLLLAHRMEQRRLAEAAERQRKLDAERKRLADLERQRLLELEYLRDPSREVRGKIHINGIIGQEVFIGNKVYTVGKSVLGARIVSVQPDAVVFTYKGQKFTKKVQIQ